MNGVDEVAIKLVKADKPSPKELTLFHKEVSGLPHRLLLDKAESKCFVCAVSVCSFCVYLTCLWFAGASTAYTPPPQHCAVLWSLPGAQQHVFCDRTHEGELIL